MSYSPESKINSLIDTKTQDRLDLLENLVAVNTLRDSVDAGWTVLDMINGISDEYSDETGVSSSTFIYSGTNDYYANFSTPEFPPNLVVRQSLTLDDTGVHTLSTSGDTSLTTGVADPWGGSEQLITFDGTGDFLSVANNAQLDLGANEDKTIEFWMFKNNGGDSVIPLHHAQFNSSGYQDMSYMVYVPGSGQLLLYTSADGTNISVLLQSSTGAIVQQTWHHVAIVVSGSNISLYLDGTQVGTTTKPSIHTSTSDLMIGHRGNSGSHLNMNGYMTDIVITPQAKYTSNFTVPSTPQEINQPATPSTLTSSTFLASSVPGRARAVMLHEPVQATDLANDLLLEVSRDGGTTYTTLPLELDADFDADVDILTSGSVDISSQPSGSNINYRITTANNKQQRIHGTWIQWY